MSDTSLESAYRDHAMWLTRWARRHVGQWQEAADVVHDVFAKLLSRPCEAPVLDPSRAYLLCAVRSQLIDRSRHSAVVQSHAESVQHAPLKEAASPEQILEAKQWIRTVIRVVQMSSHKAQKAFELHILDGHTHAYTAKQLGVSTRMVQKYLVRLLLEIDEALAQDAGARS
jgi:RNA polymerase sigma-70 factor (ECF subfamily)